jgi:hypothetical protein
MPTRPRHNPRRVPCTWCNAPLAGPCVGPNGRELTWYHEPRTIAAAELPDADQLPDPDRAPLPTPETTPRIHTPRTDTRRPTHPLDTGEVDDGPADADLRHEPRRAHAALPERPHRPDRLVPASPGDRSGPASNGHTPVPPPVMRGGRAPLVPPPRLSEPRSRHKAARDWLAYQLQSLGGHAPAQDLIRAAQAAGYSRTTLHRARQQLHITTTKPTYTSGWHWNLPAAELEPSIPETAMTSLTHAGQLALSINERARHAHRQP